MSQHLTGLLKLISVSSGGWQFPMRNSLAYIWEMLRLWSVLFCSHQKFFLMFTPASLDLCLVLLQVQKCFVPIQIFWVSPKIWPHLVPLPKLLCGHKNQFNWMQIIFLSGTKCFWLPQYVNKFLVWHKKFGPAQNILGPVKGQGINHLNFILIYSRATYTFNNLK